MDNIQSNISLGDYLSKPIGDIISDLKYYKQENKFLKDNIDYLGERLENINHEIKHKQNCERNIILMCILSNLQHQGECSKSKISEDLIDNFNSIVCQSIDFAVNNGILTYKNGYYYATDIVYKTKKCNFIGGCRYEKKCFRIHTDLEQSVRQRLNRNPLKYARYHPKSNDDRSRKKRKIKHNRDSIIDSRIKIEDRISSIRELKLREKMLNEKYIQQEKQIAELTEELKHSRNATMALLMK